jgi:hypothetical protein
LHTHGDVLWIYLTRLGGENVGFELLKVRFRFLWHLQKDDGKMIVEEGSRVAQMLTKKKNLFLRGTSCCHVRVAADQRSKCAKGSDSFEVLVRHHHSKIVGLLTTPVLWYGSLLYPILLKPILCFLGHKTDILSTIDERAAVDRISFLQTFHNSKKGRKDSGKILLRHLFFSSF